MASVELLSLLYIVLGVGGLVFRMLDVSQVGSCDHEGDIMGAEDVGAVAVVASLLLALSHQLCANALLQELHGREGIAACELKVVEPLDLKLVGLGVVVSVSVARLVVGHCCMLLLGRKKERYVGASR